VAGFSMPALGGEFAQPEFRDALLRIAGEGGAVSSKRLGKWLSKISGRIVGGLRLEMRPDKSHGSKFSLQRVNATSTDIPRIDSSLRTLSEEE